MIDELTKKMGEKKLLLCSKDSRKRRRKLKKIDKEINTLIKNEAERQAADMYKLTMDTYKSIIEVNFK